MQPLVPCLICGRELRPALAGAVGPSPGVAFVSNGHHESTVFEAAGGEWIEVSVCDPCLREGAERGRVLIGAQSRVPDPPPSYAVFAPDVEAGSPPQAPSPAEMDPIVVTAPVDSIRDVVTGAPPAAPPVAAAPPVSAVEGFHEVMHEPDLWGPSSVPCACTHFEDDRSGADTCACGHGRGEHDARGECLVGRA